MTDRWTPMPVPLGDGCHDIGDEARAAIVRRLAEDFQRAVPSLTATQVQTLAMWAGASVRALLHELGTLRDMSTPPEAPPEPPTVAVRAVGRCPECGPVVALDAEGCCQGCGHDVVLSAPTLERPAARCVWQVGVQGYHTDCGRTWFRSDRDIVRDGAVACPFCGQPLVVEAPHA